MISKNQLKTLESVKSYLDDRDKILLDDYIAFHNILMAMYRNNLSLTNYYASKLFKPKFK
jgi:hypothetical protein